VSDIEVDSKNPRNIYVAALTGGVFMSTIMFFGSMLKILRTVCWATMAVSHPTAWTRAPGLIPVAIDDIKIQMPTGDVVLGSYGRGLIIGR